LLIFSSCGSSQKRRRDAGSTSRGLELDATICSESLRHAPPPIKREPGSFQAFYSSDPPFDRAYPRRGN
jgi:hypothetical protein